MTTYPPPSPPYRGPARHTGSPVNKPINRVVIHGTVSACRPGMAEIIARYFRTTSRAASAHYVVDPGTTLQCVFDSVVAYHAPPNQHSIGVELCDPVVGPLTRWNDRDHRRMLRRAARLTAELCLAYEIPMRKVGKIALARGRKGICGHADVRDAWGQTSHWDPGAFPWRRFIRMVREEASKIEGKPTRVTRARALLDDALDLLAEVPKRRAHVHNVAESLRDDANRLPER